MIDFMGLGFFNSKYHHWKAILPNPETLGLGIPYIHVMKRFLLSVVLSIHCALGYAQSDHKFVDTRIGIGVLTAPEIIETIGSAVTDAIVSPDFSSLDVTQGGIALQGSVLFLPESRLGLGLDFVHDRSDLDFKFDDSRPTESTTVTYTSLLARMDFRYKKEGAFRIYSSAGFGFSQRTAERTDISTSEKDKSTGYSLQITPIGIRVGGRLGVWAEAGFGFRGLLSGGISFQW